MEKTSRWNLDLNGVTSGTTCYYNIRSRDNVEKGEERDDTRKKGSKRITTAKGECAKRGKHLSKKRARRSVTGAAAAVAAAAAGRRNGPSLMQLKQRAKK